MRGRDDGLETEEWRVGAGLLGVDVEARTRNPALGDRAIERVLVDDATAGSIDEVHRGLGELELLLADQASRLSSLG